MHSWCNKMVKVLEKWYSKAPLFRKGVGLPIIGLSGWIPKNLWNGEGCQEEEKSHKKGTEWEIFEKEKSVLWNIIKKFNLEKYKKYDFSKFWKDITALKLSINSNLHAISRLPHARKFINCYKFSWSSSECKKSTLTLELLPSMSLYFGCLHNELWRTHKILYCKQMKANEQLCDFAICTPFILNTLTSGTVITRSSVLGTISQNHCNIVHWSQMMIA